MTTRRDNLRKYLPDYMVDRLPDSAILFDPEELDEAIVNVKDGRAVYTYDKLVEAHFKMFRASEPERNEDDLWLGAAEWVDYNTIRSLPYLPVTDRPIVLPEEEEEE